jgi:hypothetical protein
LQPRSEKQRTISKTLDNNFIWPRSEEYFIEAKTIFKGNLSQLFRAQAQSNKEKDARNFLKQSIYQKKPQNNRGEKIHDLQKIEYHHGHQWEISIYLVFS